MAYCFIISSNIDFVNSTEKFVDKHSYYTPLKFLLRKDVYANAIESYKCLSEKFSAISFSDLREAVVLLDEYFNIHNCNAIQHEVNVDIFWGRMIVSFPELEFIFLNRTLEGSRTVVDWIENETKSNKDVAFLPLFDFNGVRKDIRKNCKKGLQERIGSARIIEDEVSYAFFHAYIAYKHNHRSKLYTTLNHLNQDKELKPHVDLQIQDLSLGFVDKREDLHLQDLEQRYKEYNFLNCVNKEKDFLITVGGKDECKQCGIETHTLKYKVEPIYKPTRGMYDISRKLNLDNPVPIEIDDNNGHSAPGILALIAENLINRAQQILDSTKQVKDAIHAATLALEAKELLNGLTPTLALQAFTLQQKAEVMAECLFVGTEYNIDLEPRFTEIEKEVKFISERFAKTEQKRVQLNTQLIIAEILSGVYNSYKQFEEELECLNKARSLNFKLKEKIKGKTFVRPLLRLGWVMDSVRNFVIFLSLMQVVFAFFYYLFLKCYQKTWIWDFTWSGISSEIKTILVSILASIKYFFTTETSGIFVNVFEQNELLGNMIRGFQGLCSLSSLSIFMAMIYLRISRK